MSQQPAMDATVTPEAVKTKRPAPYKSPELPSYSWRLPTARFHTVTPISTTRERQLHYLTDERAAESLISSLKA